MSAPTSNSEIVLALAEEFLERYRTGERPPLKEYCDRHPALAAEIREVFPAVALMENIALADESLASPLPRGERGPEPPRQLGDYRIIGEIGHGGMGVVYEAEQVSLGRHVALKVLPSAMLLDARHKRRFEREAKAAARLHHTNIVPVFGVGEHDGQPYYVMQFIHGRGLDEVLDELIRLRHAGPATEPRPGGDPRVGKEVSAADVARSLLTDSFSPADPSREAACPPTAEQPPAPDAPSDRGGRRSDSPTPPPSSATLPGPRRPRGHRQTFWQSVAHIGTQVADGLAYAHAQGVLHRDVKPSNLLLDARGTVWVADFGLAKADDQQNLTHTGDVIGTLRYMPPEAFEGKADARSDVYSLGLTLYELLASRPAFDERDRPRLIRQVTGAAPPRLDKLNPAVPRDLVTVVHKAIDREPGRRYQTAVELAADLQRFLDDRPVRARRISSVERLGRWCRRNPALATASGLAAAALVAVAVVSIGFAIHQTRAAADLNRALSEKEEKRVQLVREQKQTKAALASMALDRGRNLGEQGDVGPGMLWMVRGLEFAVEAEDTDLQRVIRWNLAGWYRKLHPWRTTFPHAGWVWAAAFSPDGKTVWTGCADKKVRHWDVATGREIGPTLEHADEVRALAVSRDGKIIVTGSFDKTARLWDAATGKPLCPPLPHEGQVHAVAISPDGKTVFTSGVNLPMRLWEVATSQPLKQPFADGSSKNVSPPRVLTAAFSPDGKTIVTGTDVGKVMLWKMAGDQFVLGPSMIHGGSVNTVTFSPDGQTVASGGAGQLVKFWNAADGQQIGPTLQHEGHVRSVAFSPDGKSVATASNDAKARLWDVATGTLLGPPLQHAGGTVFAAAFSPDGRTILTGDSEEARLWTVADQHPGTTLQPQVMGSFKTFSPDGKTIVTGTLNRGPSQGSSIRLWDAATVSPAGEMPRHKLAIHSAAFSPDGKTLLTGGNSQHAANTVWLWDVATGNPHGPPLPQEGTSHAGAFSPDGKTILVAFITKDRSFARLWDVATRQPIGKSLLPPQGFIRAVAFSPDGKTVLTGSRTAQLWDAATAEPLGPPMRHQRPVRAVAFSPDSKAILTGSEDGTARLWETATGKPIGMPMPHQAMVLSVAFSPDGKTVQTGSADNTARLWDAATGRPVGPPLRHPAIVHAVAFRPDGKTALSGSDRFVGRLAVLVPVEGEVERIKLWVQVSTGMEMDEDGLVNWGTTKVRQERIQRLQALGGPPRP